MSLFTDIYLLNFNGVRVIVANEIKNKIKKFLDDSHLSYKEFCLSIDIDYTTFWDYFNRRSAIPLNFFFMIKKNYSIDFSPYFEYFEVGHLKKRIKIVKKLSNELAKVLGAHVADGNLRIRQTTFRGNVESKHYELIIREEYENNIQRFCNWFNSVFDYNLKYKKEVNHYSVYLSNRLILEYFRLFGIPIGPKTDIISVPTIIKNSSLGIKRSFLTGLFMFDGSVEYVTCNVSLVCKSKSLIEDTNTLLMKINLKPDLLYLYPDKFGRYKIIFNENEKIRKFLDIFEEKTEKWYRIHEHLYGFKKYENDKNGLIKDFKKYYPCKRKSSLSFHNFIEIMPEGGEFESSFFMDKLKRKRSSIYSYLNKLEKWKILTSRKNGKSKLYKLNENLPMIIRS